MAVYYNDSDAYCAEWLRNLISAGHIPAGDVDSRPVETVHPVDLWGYRQCHFFAGIGGWALAQRLAGWPDDDELWTGSCPCQPFSQAGQKRGMQDRRHLWPAWFRLVCASRPALVMGEQVASPVALRWLDTVADDLETHNYRFRALALPACATGAIHIRERLWWAAACGMGDADSTRLQGWRLRPEMQSGQRAAWPSGAVAVRCADGKARFVEPGICPLAHGVSARMGRLRAYGNAIVPQLAAEVLKAWIG